MKIVIFGAGAIGSLFGAFLSKKHDVVLIGRKPHVEVINNNGLKIIGKTKLIVKPFACDLLKNLNFIPDLLILTVKSYDTEIAIKNSLKIIDNKTYVLSLQNGLGNVEILRKYVDSKKIFAGITTHGAFFSKSGVVEHTGFGDTIIGGVDGEKTRKVEKIVEAFNSSGIKTSLSCNIIKDIWLKAVVNSSINPLSMIFECKNGYLLENPILNGIVERICYESCDIANAQGLNIDKPELFSKTVNVIKETSENYSSMLQSYYRGKKTEIDSINGQMVKVGGEFGVSTMLNQCLVVLVKSKNLNNNC